MRRQTTAALSIAIGILGCAAFTSPAQAGELTSSVTLDISAQPLEAALLELSKQTGMQLVINTGLLPKRTSPRLNGSMSIQSALDILLKGTNLTYKLSGERTVSIIPPATTSANSRYESSPGGNDQFTRLAQADAANPVAQHKTAGNRVELEEVTVAIPEILVVGSKILNMDIRRSEDDVQPYVIFDRATIGRSGVRNIEEFLKQRLPMNSQGYSYSQGSGEYRGSASSINLRGLGTNQTLILIDGRRTANRYVSFGTTEQPDLNGIPLAAVERIEVLPTTASGIYGGSATGGVINIVMRRDYDGAEAKLTYDNTFDTNSAIRRVDAGAGFSFEDGRTNVLIAASYADADPLYVRDRMQLFDRGIATILRNNPGYILNFSTPPLGASTNIRSADGSNLVLRDGTSLGSAYTSVPVGYRGAGSDSGAGLLANAGSYNVAAARGAQRGASSIENNPTVKSLAATLRRTFSDHVDAFLDLEASGNRGSTNYNTSGSSFFVPATAPSNPFRQNVRVRAAAPAADGVAITQSDSRRVTGGVIIGLPHGWMTEADYSWATSSMEFSFPAPLSLAAAAAVANGSIDVFRDDSIDFSAFVQGREFGDHTLQPFQSTQKNISLRAAGPAISLPAGPLTLTGQVERRDQDFDDGSYASASGGRFFPSRSQSVNSAYVEASVPILSARSGVPGVQQLDFQLAVRYDDYETIGSRAVTGPTDPIVRTRNKFASTNPTLGFRYQPVRDVMLRASYGTGFLPPSIDQLTPNVPQRVPEGSYADPRRGGEAVSGDVQYISGGTTNLQPEESASWSAGVVLEPRFAPGLRLSLDYTRIDKTDGITTLSDGEVLLNEAFLPGRVTRGPVQPGDPFGVGRITQVDGTAVNLAKARIQAYDLQLDYRFDTQSAGSFEFFTAATWQTHYQTQVTPAAPVVENVGVAYFNPLRLRANAGLTWTRDRWMLGWITRYFDSYVVSRNPTTVLNQGNSGLVPEQIYHDVLASYRLSLDEDGRTLGALKGIELQLGLKNVLNATPPVDVVGIGSVGYSPYGDPRLRSYQLSVKATF